MKRRILYSMAVVALLLGTGAMQTARAEGDAVAPREKRWSGGGGGGGGGNRAQFILKHADDLNLTDEQKEKLDALVKESAAAGAVTPENAAAQKEKLDAVLTDAQREKMKELFKARTAERTAGAGADAADLPKPQTPPAPHIEDKVHATDLLQFILSHQTELFLRADQKDLFDPLAEPAKVAGADAAMKKQFWEILTGQQIGKLREMLKKHPEMQTLGLAPAPAKAQ